MNIEITTKEIRFFGWEPRYFGRSYCQHIAVWRNLFNKELRKYFWRELKAGLKLR